MRFQPIGHAREDSDVLSSYTGLKLQLRTLFILARIRVDMKRLHQNCGFGNDFSAEFPDYFPLSSPHRFMNQTSVTSNNLWPSSSSTIIGRIGSASNALYATEVLMGLPQCDFQENNSISFKSSYPRLPSFGNGWFDQSSTQVQPIVTRTQSPTSHLMRFSGSYRNPPDNVSESEQLQYLKNKLLGEFDESTQDLRVSPSRSELD